MTLKKKTTSRGALAGLKASADRQPDLVLELNLVPLARVVSMLVDLRRKRVAIVLTLT